jgi:hypothetical protein
MSAPYREDLLVPSLSPTSLRQAPYTTTTGYLVAFFGGPLMALLLGGLNARRGGRLAQDVPWLLAIAVAVLALDVALLRTTGGQAALGVLRQLLGGNASTLLWHVTGLLCFAATSLAHARLERMAALSASPRPNGIWLGIGLCVLGNVLYSIERGWLQ